MVDNPDIHPPPNHQSDVDKFAAWQTLQLQRWACPVVMLTPGAGA